MTFSFGASAQPATATAGAFGAAPATAQPSFGFGASGASSTPTLGGFGSTATTSAPAFGGFGQTTQASAAPSFGGFGQTTQPSAAPTFGGFGTTATTSAPAFGGFGSTATTSAPTFGGFGSTATTSAPTFGGFGQAAQTSTAPTFGGFGSTATTSAPTFGGFGQTQTTSAAPAFGGFGFGSSASTGAPTLGGFGTTTSSAPLTFGTGISSSSAFGGLNNQSHVCQPQQQQQSGEAALYQSVMQVQLFNDTRDAIMARLNMLQASWGQGKAFYSNQAQPLTLAQDNPLCRFKAVGYSMIPKHDNAEGLVSIAISKKVSEVEAGKTQFVTSLTQMLGNKPGFTVSVESIKGTGDTCEVVITVSENVNGQVKKTPAQDLSNFLQTQAAQLKVYSVTGVYPKLGFSKTELAEYLDKAPSGVDPRLWKQAVADNPSPDKMIPVPLIGFKALQARISAQEAQNKAQCGRLDVLAQEIDTLKKKQADAIAALTEAKRKEAELGHRVLRVMVGQESRRKVGYTISREEEQLFSQLESVAAELATPTQFRGRLQELLSCVRLQSQVVGGGGGGGEKYSLDSGAVNNIKEVLTEQQRGIQAMMQVVKDDFNDLDVILKKIKK